MLRDIADRIPEHRDLDSLLTFIADGVRKALGSESASVMLLDDERGELFFRALDSGQGESGRRLREVRFPASTGLAGEVLRSGKPLRVDRVGEDPRFYTGVDRDVGSRTRSLAYAPLKADGRTIGVLGAVNRLAGRFSQADLDFLVLLANTVSLSITNARVWNDLQAAHAELQALNEAKARMMDHLTHELHTPLAVLSATLRLLKKPTILEDAQRSAGLIDRMERNLARLTELGSQLADVTEGRRAPYEQVAKVLAAEYEDLLSAAAGEHEVSDSVATSIRSRIEEIFGAEEEEGEATDLGRLAAEVLGEGEAWRHRRVEVSREVAPSCPRVLLPPGLLRKALRGILRNAIENTPDGGAVRVDLRCRGETVWLAVEDSGIGMTPEFQAVLFHGFQHPGETHDYSTRRPFDFRAGGRGLDLLRTRLFAERLGFRVHVSSEPCPHAHGPEGCPGRVEDCANASGTRCAQHVGSRFALEFPGELVETERYVLGLKGQ